MYYKAYKAAGWVCVKFEQIYKDAVKEWESIHNDKIPRIFSNLDSCGRAAGAAAIAEHINAEIKQNKISAKVIEVGSTGLSYLEPLIYIRKNGQPAVFYGKVTKEVASQILNEYVTKNNPLPELALCTMGAENISGIPQISELPIYKGQIRIALRNCGLIDPCKIKHYIARDGYGGLKKALKSGAKEVIEEIERAGLRGRGGAGFSTARKWKICREVKAEEKYVICNAHEGDPASFGIRLLLESDPHAVLEGMLICAFSVGATKGYIYINNEYALAIERVKRALSQMKEVGLLGCNILESGFSFDMEVFHAGAEFVW